MDVVFINVGYGEAILVRQNDFVMLIDGGDDSETEYVSNTGRVRCLDCLKSLGINHIDIMVNTHIHADHVSGLVGVAGELPVGEFWTPFGDSLKSANVVVAPDCNPSLTLFSRALNAYGCLLRHFADKGVPIRTVTAAGERAELPYNISLDLLGPDAYAARNMVLDIEAQLDKPRPCFGDIDRRMNNASLMMRLGFEGKYILLPADANKDGYLHLRADDARLKADVFKIGHHGQIDGVTREQLAHIGAKFVVITASSDRRYNSARPEIIDMIRENSARPLFTDSLPGFPPPVRRALYMKLQSTGIDWRYM